MLKLFVAGVPASLANAAGIQSRSIVVVEFVNNKEVRMWLEINNKLYKEVEDFKVFANPFGLPKARIRFKQLVNGCDAKEVFIKNCTISVFRDKEEEYHETK